MSYPSPITTETKPIIHIPAIKRHHQSSIFGIPAEENGAASTMEDHFQALKIELQECKCELGLGTMNSGFTKVSSTDDDFAQSFKYENTRASFLSENSQPGVSNFQSLIKFIQKADLCQQNQQKQFVTSTKNILRNMCNAQNQYILFNQCASQTIHQHLANPKKFKQWVNKLRFHTFEQFQRVWTSKKRPVYTKLYKKLCRKFYLENAVPYIINSRIKNRETKKAHIRYLYRFLEGVESPQGFFYFKQKDKDKVEVKQEQLAVEK